MDTNTNNPAKRIEVVAVRVAIHGHKVEVEAPLEAVMASDWASDNKALIRTGDAATATAASEDRNANIDDARNLANAAAASMLRGQRGGWLDRAGRTKLALRMVRKVK